MTPTKHMDTVRSMGCCVCRNKIRATFHHCHGGSIIEWFGFMKNPGMGQRQSDWLGIPLCHHHHVGSMGIDTGMGGAVGVIQWEWMFGTQIGHLLWVDDQLKYDIFEMAMVPRPPEKLRNA